MPYFYIHIDFIRCSIIVCIFVFFLYVIVCLSPHLFAKSCPDWQIWIESNYDSDDIKSEGSKVNDVTADAGRVLLMANLQKAASSSLFHIWNWRFCCHERLGVFPASGEQGDWGPGGSERGRAGHGGGNAAVAVCSQPGAQVSGRGGCSDLSASHAAP